MVKNFCLKTVKVLTSASQLPIVQRWEVCEETNPVNLVKTKLQPSQVIKLPDKQRTALSYFQGLGNHNLATEHQQINMLSTNYQV